MCSMKGEVPQKDLANIFGCLGDKTRNSTYHNLLSSLVNPFQCFDKYPNPQLLVYRIILEGKFIYIKKNL